MMMMMMMMKMMNASFILQKSRSAEYKKKTAGINLCAIIRYFKIRTIEQLKSFHHLTFIETIVLLYNIQSFCF